jgi:hypothetical protein
MKGIIMIKKHTVGFCASFGLAVGIVMFLATLALRYLPASAFFGDLIVALNAPAIGLIKQLHDESYNWGSFAGLSQALMAFLAYWLLLGTLAGIGLRAFFSRKHRANAA